MYILYNSNKSSILNDIIDYLDDLGYNLTPEKYINKIEALVWLTLENELIDTDPLIFSDSSVILTDSREIYIGEKECIQYFTNQTCIIHLSEKSSEFKKLYNKKIKID